MRIIDLDASTWRRGLDFYDALLPALGAPAWHGRNINALLETMVWYDDINAVSPPYLVRIKNFGQAGGDAQREVVAVQNAFAEAALDYRRENGRDVKVAIQAE